MTNSLKYTVEMWLTYHDMEGRVCNPSRGRPWLHVHFQNWEHRLDLINMGRVKEIFRVPDDSDPNSCVPDGPFVDIWVVVPYPGARSWDVFAIAEGITFTLPWHYLRMHHTRNKGLVLNPFVFTDLGKYWEAIWAPPQTVTQIDSRNKHQIKHLAENMQAEHDYQRTNKVAPPKPISGFREVSVREIVIGRSKHNTVDAKKKEQLAKQLRAEQGRAPEDDYVPDLSPAARRPDKPFKK